MAPPETEPEELVLLLSLPSLPLVVPLLLLPPELLPPELLEPDELWPPPQLPPWEPRAPVRAKTTMPNTATARAWRSFTFNPR
ncbi:hypothetical protein [Streptomyces sp. CS62]|uniref:hypothetical protein n=1 Tax=Streptomyces sp. CS62 TaxID=3119268 RepID=UPI002F9207DF